MAIEEQYRMLINAYYGTREMEEYKLYIFILKDLETYIKEFIKINQLQNFNYKKEAEIISESTTLKRKLQDALITLPKIKAPLELILLIKEKIRNIDEERQ